MQQYEDLEEKAGHFLQCQTINTPEELNKALADIQDKANNPKLHIVFRGVHEAKYKLFNSFQRMWFEYGFNESNKDPFKFVQDMINHCFNEEHVLFKYFKQLGVICNDWLILSFLQHYGAASPLLDFSKNYKVALYFLCKGLKPYYGNNKIGHYTSIYYYKYVDAGKKFRSVENYAVEIVEKNPRINKVEIWKNELSFSSLMKRPPATAPVIIPVHTNRTNIKTLNKVIATHFTAANINLTSQEGEFVCNMDIEKPLEDVFLEDGTKYICCLNIHKGLRQYIIDKYLDSSLEKHDNTFFPSEERIAHEAFTETLNNIFKDKAEEIQS